MAQRAFTPPENIKTNEYFWTAQKYQNPEIHSKKLTPQICSPGSGCHGKHGHIIMLRSNILIKKTKMTNVSPKNGMKRK